ncbi:acyl-CoA-binding protein [uncultured Polaribacter sp.]|uniref:acyl-CoA-binding protein n=1 Tax=uncultured Polaribacter sp. TaxID=174711 RepID=UPI002633F2B2|nr:acyl-CoA-binding protein [uncultured Polaribacter sp.]
MSKELDLAFKEAFDKISDLKKEIAPDIKLKFYAYYKKANYGNNFSLTKTPSVRNAFKMNAWMQVKNMSSEEAKNEYIKLANSILNKKQ